MNDKVKFKVFIVAGEASGDALGAKLIKSLIETKENFEFKGLGGSKMAAEGCTSYFDISDISVMGFAEVLPKIPKLLFRIRQLVKAACEFKPDIVITIDSYSFNHRLVRRLRKIFNKSIPFVHFVAPTVWAYKPNRVKTIAALYDHQILLLPFEKPYFDKANVNSTFIGHPIIEDLASQELEGVSRENLIVIMPGSRKQEIKYHAKIFYDAIKFFDHEDYKFFIPTVPHLEQFVREIFSDGGKFIISSNPLDKKEYFKKAKAAIVKSGTSSIEMMLYEIPCLVAYKMSPITYWWIKRQVNIKYVTLCNLILDYPIIPELIQNECTASNIATKLSLLIYDHSTRAKMINCYKNALDQLGRNSIEAPSQKAASIILRLLN